MIIQQIESDSQFLKKNNIIDYSLLVGIHIPEANLRKSKTLINEGKIKEESKQKINPIESDHHISIQNSQNNNNVNKIKRCTTSSKEKIREKMWVIQF